MEEKEVTEGNKLIAKFMGGVEEYDAPLGWIKGVEGLPDFQDRFELTRGKYHFAWDWLMSVVEKIERVSESPCIQFWVTIEGNECTIEDETEEQRFSHISASKIEATWKAVIKFIKWYNQQTLKQ